MDITNGLPQPSPDDSSAPVGGAAATGGIVNSAAATAPSAPPAPAPAPAPAAPEKPSLWRNLLAGALSGMASSAGGKNLGEGLALGAKGELSRERQVKDDATDDQKQKAEAQRIAIQTAHTQAETALLYKQVSALPDNYQMKVAEGRADQTEQMRRTGAMIPVGAEDPSPDHHNALNQIVALTKANPGRLYTAEPIRGANGKIAFQPMESTDALITEDLPIKDIHGKVIATIPKNTLSGKEATRQQIAALTQGVGDLSVKAQVSQQNADSNTTKAEAALAAAKAKAAAAAGTGEWKPKVTADEKKKAELAENIAVNAEAVAATLQKRPDLVGAIAGRFTSFEQMVGNNDPDIAAIATHIHNLAMANSGVHGFRSHEGVVDNEKQLFNNFKNGPKAVGGALQASVHSVQTFIDNARPETYKTHSKMGGVLKGMAQ